MEISQLSRSIRCGLSLSACGIAFIAGCTVGPDYHKPDPKMPAAWSSPTVPEPTTRASTQPSTQPGNVSVATTQPTDVAVWWKTFNDPTLDSLIERAVKSNLTLKEAESRLRESRASRTSVAAGEYPTADVGGDYRRSRGAGAHAHSRDSFGASVDASWELDIFGGVRRGVEAADADIQSAVEDVRDVMVSLSAEVALDYIELRGFQREIAIARRNLTAQARTADITRQRKELGGLANALDVANAESQVASTAAQIPSLQTAERQTIYALSILLGETPDALVEELSQVAPIPGTPPAVPIGLPSELLKRRPDIRRAEASLHSATARIGEATADLFPRFSLSGNIGTSASTLGGLTRWDNRSWSIGPSVSWPLFDAGRIRANIAVQNEVQVQALLAYRQTVLTAIQEVESALIAYVKEQEHHELLVQSVESNRRATDLSFTLWRNGNTSFLDVLNAERSLFGSELSLAQSDQTIATNLVTLYKALGGGWDESTASPTTMPAR